MASEYQKSTHRPLLDTPFLAWSYGPVGYLVYDQTRRFSQGSVEKFLKDSCGKTLALDEKSNPEFVVALTRVWAAAKGMNGRELIEMTRAPGSAWAIAFQAGRSIIDQDDVGADDTYREKLGLPPLG